MPPSAPMGAERRVTAHAAHSKRHSDHKRGQEGQLAAAGAGRARGGAHTPLPCVPGRQRLPLLAGHPGPRHVPPLLRKGCGQLLQAGGPGGGAAQHTHAQSRVRAQAAAQGRKHAGRCVVRAGRQPQASPTRHPYPPPSTATGTPQPRLCAPAAPGRAERGVGRRHAGLERIPRLLDAVLQLVRVVQHAVQEAGHRRTALGGGGVGGNLQCRERGTAPRRAERPWGWVRGWRQPPAGQGGGGILRSAAAAPLDMLL
jgi:hypothetical protein